MAITMLGKKQSEEAKRKISMALMGNKNNKGNKGFLNKKHTDKTKEAIRLSKMNTIVSEVTKSKMSLARTGDKNAKWIVDRTTVKQYWTERNNPEYKQWRRNVMVRDGFKCKISDNNCSNGIVAHHILPWAKHPELRYEINNGITLCKFHHPRKRDEEIRLTSLFQKQILN